MISKKKRWIVKVLAFLTIIAIILGIIYYLISTYTIKTVYVEGNLHYSSDEIKEIVMDGPLGSNSLYLSLKYRNAGIENVPFVDVMNVEILSPDTIKIVVYEKALAGYIEYMDNYLYFDKDGYVVENSSIMTEGIPLITGFDFEYVVMGEKLPVKNEVIFTNVMDITKLLSKYKLTADKIYFASESDITVFFEDIKVTLGNTKNLEEKIMNLPQFLSKLKGKKGTLNLENYSQGTEMTIFTQE